MLQVSRYLVERPLASVTETDVAKKANVELSARVHRSGKLDATQKTSWTLGFGPTYLSEPETRMESRAPLGTWRFKGN